MAIPDESHVFVVRLATASSDMVSLGDSQHFERIQSSGTFRLVSARHFRFWDQIVFKQVADSILCADYVDENIPKRATVVFFENMFDHSITRMPVWTFHADISIGTCAEKFGNASGTDIAEAMKRAEEIYGSMRKEFAKMGHAAAGSVQTPAVIAAPPQWGGENGN